MSPPIGCSTAVQKLLEDMAKELRELGEAAVASELKISSMADQVQAISYTLTGNGTAGLKTETALLRREVEELKEARREDQKSRRTLQFMMISMLLGLLASFLKTFVS